MKKIWVVIIVSIVVACVFYTVGRAHEKAKVKKAIENGNEELPTEEDPNVE